MHVLLTTEMVGHAEMNLNESIIGSSKWLMLSLYITADYKWLFYWWQANDFLQLSVHMTSEFQAFIVVMLGVNFKF